MNSTEQLQESLWNCQTRFHGENETLRDRFEVFVSCVDDGNGIDITNGKPVKTFEQWLAS
jgi:hypothetical protein